MNWGIFKQTEAIERVIDLVEGEHGKTERYCRGSNELMNLLQLCSGISAVIYFHVAVLQAVSFCVYAVLVRATMNFYI